MLSVARRFLHDEELARDAVQDAFLSAFRAIHAFDGDAQLSTWLHRIVVNAALMKLRTRRRKPEQSIEPMLPAFAEDGHHADAAGGRLDRFGRADAAAAGVARAGAGGDRRAAGELSHGAAAARHRGALDARSRRLLGISENALKLRLHRARQALATKLHGVAR